MIKERENTSITTDVILLTKLYLQSGIVPIQQIDMSEMQ